MPASRKRSLCSSFAPCLSNSVLPAAVYSVHRLWHTHRHFAIAGGIVACFHGLCEAGTQIKAIKGFVGTPCRVAGKFTRAALHAK